MEVFSPFLSYVPCAMTRSNLFYTSLISFLQPFRQLQCCINHPPEVDQYVVRQSAFYSYKNDERELKKAAMAECATQSMH